VGTGTGVATIGTACARNSPHGIAANTRPSAAVAISTRRIPVMPIKALRRSGDRRCDAPPVLVQLIII